MNSKVLIILILVVAIVAGVGIAILLLTRQAAPAPIPTPLATPVVQIQTKPELSAMTPSSTLSVGEKTTIDIYLDTKSSQINGFQFIANIDGTAFPAVLDADDASDGMQIEHAQIPELSVSTNSVIQQDGRYVVRYAMVTSDEASGFSSTSPVKVASIPVTPGTAGSIQVTFNAQNSRARVGAGSDEVMLAVADTTYTVTDPMAGTSSAASGSATTTTDPLLTAASFSATPVPSATPSSGVVAQYCLASCITDSDCAVGLTCEADHCVNPACATSQTCSCSQTAQATLAPTATPRTIAAVSTPVPTIAPVEDTTQLASTSAEDLPTAGTIEQTFLAIGSGLLLLGAGITLASRKAPVS